MVLNKRRREGRLGMWRGWNTERKKEVGCNGRRIRQKKTRMSINNCRTHRQTLGRGGKGKETREGDKKGWIRRGETESIRRKKSGEVSRKKSG